MDKKIRDLFNEEVLKEASAKYDLRREQLKSIGGFENFVYEFEKENKPYIMRITHSSHRTIEMIEAEMDWIGFLNKHGVSCSLPLLSHEQKLSEIVGDPESPFIVCAFDKVPGEHLKKEMDNDQFRFEYGKMLGKMHSLTKKYQPLKNKRKEWFEDDLIENFKEIIPVGQDLLLDVFRENVAQIMCMKKSIDNYGLIHYDAHVGNFFLDNGDIHIFDFDDSQYSFYVADVAVVLFYYSMHCPKDIYIEPFISNFFNTFLDGYLTENWLSTEEIAKIPIFLKQREFMLYAAVYKAYHENEFSGWAKYYMTGRREKLEKSVPYVPVDFIQLYNEVIRDRR